MSEFDRLLTGPAARRPADPEARTAAPGQPVQRRYTGPVPPPLRQMPAATTPGATDIPRKPVGPRLRVDWPACKAHGLCAELLPERVRLDEWGYPIIEGRPLSPQLLDAARRAVISCPTVALRLVDPT